MQKRVVVIGGGPGGYTAALRASQLGAAVTLVEKKHVGGTCLNAGCIPTKSLLDSSFMWHRGGRLFHRQDSGEVPWNLIMARKSEAVRKLRGGVEGLLRAGKVTVVNGTATLLNKQTVAVEGERTHTLEADILVLATGSRPVRPRIAGIDLPGVVTSDEILEIDALPKRLAIIGGGVIGMEFATIFAELGVKVEVVEAAARLLPNWDSDISSRLRKHLEAHGVTFQLGKKVEAIEEHEGSPAIRLADGGRTAADLVLLAVGREAVLDQLGLELAGVKMNGKKIAVNAFQQTSQSSVYAVGDCSSPVMLAHAAMAEATVAIEHALGLSPRPVDYECVPQCVYTHPEAAMVGLTREQAEARGFDVREGVFPLKASGRASVEGDPAGLIKVVAEKRYGRVLGAHLLAPHATEMIAAIGLAITLEATTDELLQTIYPHPTIAEGLHEAVLASYGKAIHLPNRA
jgi:dihydrolipoamide dehydrogenase